MSRLHKSLAIAALVAAGALVTATANATPFVMTITEQGGDVVASGSGAFDLTGLVNEGASTISAIGMQPSAASITTGALPASVDVYAGAIMGPSSFGSGSGNQASSGNGDAIQLFGDISSGEFFWLPANYTSESYLSSSATWSGVTFASLGLSTGTYTWAWGNGPDQSYTLQVGFATLSVPEPSALAMFGGGLLLLGAFVGLRRRMA